MSIEPELRALSERALVRPAPDLVTLVVTGADRLTWLGGMVTGDVKGLAPGAATRTLIVGTTGRLLADVWVVVAAERVLLGLPRAHVESVRSHLEAHLVMEDAELEVVDAAVWWFAYGPSAEAVATVGARLGATVGVGALVGLHVAAMAIPRGASRNLAEDLTATTGALLATPEGWQRVRVERLLPEAGLDFELGGYPQEARLERFAVSFQKGCYVGQEAVYMLEKRGHAPKRLARLRVQGRADVAVGEEVLTEDGSVAGTVATVSPADADAWVLAMLRHKHTAPGTSLMIGGARAEVSEPED